MRQIVTHSTRHKNALPEQKLIKITTLRCLTYYESFVFTYWLPKDQSNVEKKCACLVQLIVVFNLKVIIVNATFG